MDKEQMLKLDNQLCFAVYAASKEIIRIYRPYLDALGITYTQYITLLVLWEKEDVTVKELGERLYLDSGTLTPLLKKMEGMGLLYRSRSTFDERQVLIRLTEKGKKLKNAAYEIPTQVFCSTHLTRDEAIALRTQLQALLSRLPCK